MSQSGEREPRASAEALLKKAQKLEHQLRTTLQTKGFAEGTAYALLTTLRSIYQDILLIDHAFAVEHDVEQALWRGIYRRIEDFRSRIRKYSQADSGKAGAPPPSGAKKPVPPKEALQKALAAFRGFLGDATGFYHELVFKLRALYGLPQDFSPAVPQEVAARVSPDTLRLCQASCHRCLIYLGDLARYKELHSESKTKDWSIVANYYLQAAALWPASGNPHNQLAVLATYVDDELLAVYRYYRSLAVEVPFLTARDNLLMLFEKNRVKYSQLGSSKKDAPSTGSKDGLSNFGTRFVRLNGIIFTKTSVETFSDVYTATMADLDALLDADDMALESALRAEKRSGTGPSNGAAVGLQVAVISMFTVHNLSWVPEGHKPTYAEIIQSSTLTQHAYTVLFEVGARLLNRCGLADNPAISLLVPSILVLLEWLTCSPKAALGDADVSDRQARARAFFWRKASELLNDVIRFLGDDLTRNETLMLPAALWEDYELRGFEPLAIAHKMLDFSKPAPSLDVGSSLQAAERARRILAAGKCLASSSADANAEGLRFSEELGTFLYSREVSQRRPEDFKVLERGEELGIARVSGAGELGMGKHPMAGELGLARDPVAGELGVAKNSVAGELGMGKNPVAGKLVVAKIASEDAETEEEEDLRLSSKEELEAAKKQLFLKAQEAGKLQGAARDELAAQAERIFKAQLAAKKERVKQTDDGKLAVKKDGVKQTNQGLDEDEEEIVFQPSRRASSQASPIIGSPMQSQSPRLEIENPLRSFDAPVSHNFNPAVDAAATLNPTLNPAFNPSSALNPSPKLHQNPAPKQDFPSPSDPVIGSSGFSFNQWAPGGTLPLDAAKLGSFLQQEKAPIDANTTSAELQAKGLEQLKQLLELQQQLQAPSFRGGAVGQPNLPPASNEILSAQQQYYQALLQANQNAPPQHAPPQNPPSFQQWIPQSSGSLFGASDLLMGQQSNIFGNPGFGANYFQNPGLNGGPLQESRVPVPVPQPFVSQPFVPQPLAAQTQNLPTASLFAAPPVQENHPPNGLDFLFGPKTSRPLSGGRFSPARTPPPGFGQPVRPPPGFGQHLGSPYAANGAGESPVDDYKWLDEYTHTIPPSAEHLRHQYALGEPSIWGRGANVNAGNAQPEWWPQEKQAPGRTNQAEAHETKNPFVP